MFFLNKIIAVNLVYSSILSLGMMSLSYAYATDSSIPTTEKTISSMPQKADTHPTKKTLIKGPSIEGEYHCTNLQGGHLRKLKIIEDEKISPTEKGFYSFTLYLTAGNERVYSNSTGYMIFDTKRQTASGYMRNQVDSQIEGVGMLYFKLSTSNQVTFEAYFIDRSENRVGSNLCAKQK